MLKAVDQAAAFCHYMTLPHLFFVALQYYPHAKILNKGTPLGPALFCLAIHPVHPLSASFLWSADNDVVSRAEQVKVLKYSDLCDRAHLLLSPTI